MPKRIIDLPVDAGVYTEQSARGATGRWKDSDKVRFRYGLVEKLGGWQKINNAFIGLARRLWDWASLDGRTWVAIGTESKLYLWQTGTLYDITPLRRAAGLTNPFDTTNTSDIVIVTDVAHGAQQGDYVQFEGATPVGGITIDGEYQIQSITGIDTYTIQDDQVASSTANGGGTVTATYDISVGLTSTAFGVGWGTGTWSQGTWNTPRTQSSTLTSLRTWSLDNWGEDLIASPRGGSLYWWDRDTGPTTRAMLLEEAPLQANYMIISQRDRHLFALGASDGETGRFDPLLIRWCSTEDFNDWTPISTNTSGDLRIFRGSKIVTAVRTRGEILVFTDASTHQINYLGGQAVYGLSVAGENVTILGPNAAIEVDFRVYFMAEGDFYVYDGVLRPIPCYVRNLVYQNLNNFQKDKVFAGLNREFNEIWWFYPSVGEGVLISSDFTTGSQSDEYGLQTMAGTPRYAVAFNPAGYIETTAGFATTAYDNVWLNPATELANPLDAEYEMVFSLSTVAAVGNCGLMVEITDFDGTADTHADNLQAISFELQVNNDRAYLRYRTSGGTILDLANGTSPYELSALADPVALTTGVDYVLTMKRDGATVSFYITDPTNTVFKTQLIDSFDLSTGEQSDFDGTSTVTGPCLWMKDIPATGVGVMQCKSFRVGEAGSLVNETEQGANDEINRYVIYNYQEETWAVGRMVRTAWHDRSPVFNDPYAANTDGFLYQHEITNDDDGAAMVAFVESYDMEIPESGEYLAHVDQMIPDFVTLEGSVDLTLKGKKYPQVADYQTKGPYNVAPGTAKVSTRIRARQVALRIESSALGDKWRMGTLRVRVMPHGKRA